jgi:hypothetical protein
MQDFHQFTRPPEPARAILKPNIDRCKRRSDARVETSQKIVHGVGCPVAEATAGARMNVNRKMQNSCAPTPNPHSCGIAEEYRILLPNDCVTQTQHALSILSSSALSISFGKIERVNVS